MKKPADVFITLYLIFTISEITCVEKECRSINEVCSIDEDCCYQKCSYSLFHFKRYCNDNTNLLSTITSYFSTKAQIGMCSYEGSLDTEFGERMYYRYGLNAAHNSLPPGTEVEVLLADKKVMVTINNHHPITSGVMLAFSKETAKVLNIKSGEVVPCNIIVSKLDNNQYLRVLKYVLPYLSIFTLLFILF